MSLSLRSPVALAAKQAVRVLAWSWRKVVGISRCLTSIHSLRLPAHGASSELSALQVSIQRGIHSWIGHILFLPGTMLATPSMICVDIVGTLAWLQWVKVLLVSPCLVGQLSLTWAHGWLLGMLTVWVCSHFHVVELIMTSREDRTHGAAKLHIFMEHFAVSGHWRTCFNFSLWLCCVRVLNDLFDLLGILSLSLRIIRIHFLIESSV